MTDATYSSRRVLVITRNLPPLVGGMEQLLRTVIQELHGSFDVSVIGPKGCKRELRELSTVKEIRPYPLWYFLATSLWRGFLLNRRLRSQIIFAGSGLTAPIALLIARLTGTIVVAQLHGLDLVAENWIYRSFFVPSLRRLDAVIVNSRHTASLAVEKQIPKDRIFIVHPGAEPPQESTDLEFNEFLTTHELAGKRVLLFVGRITARKGLSKFVDWCMPKILERCPNATLVIVGAPPNDALKTDRNEIANVKESIVANKLQDQVYLFGRGSNELRELCYRASEVFVFPAISLPGDTEGFGIVAIEAAARGVPTVAFSVDGIVDAVKDGHSGFLVSPGDYATFGNKVIQLLNDKQAISPTDCLRHAERFSNTNFGRHLRSVMNEILRRINDKV